MGGTWVSAPHKDFRVWLSVDLATRRIKFCYDLGEGGIYRFTLLSECRDDVQKMLKQILRRDKIKVMKVSDEMDYYTIVTDSEFLIFDK